jgi:hypothetical protein
MRTKTSRQFLTLVEDVADDGELSKTEIYRLAQWINENREAREHWPVNQFLPLLKGIFADGKIDNAEAREVAHLLQTVLRDWERSKISSQAATPDDVVASAISTFDPMDPRLPAIPISIVVESDSEPGVQYSVNFAQPDCSCPDFRSQRQRLPEGHLSRCCQHLMRGYSQLRPSAGWPAWLDSFLEAGFRPTPKQKWQVLEFGKNAMLISSAERDWSNLYMKSNGQNRRFGYNVVEQRWAYETPPPHEAQVAAAMNKLSL